MENLTGQGKAQGAKPQDEQTEFFLFSPEKAPEFFVVLDTKDRDMLYLGKDKAKAERILKCMNNEWKIDMHKELVEALDFMKSQLETLRLEDGIKKDISNERINMLSASLFSANKVLKKAERK